MPDKHAMTRYNNMPRFLGKGRTRFDLSHSILTTGNTGELIPILCEPVVPGSTFSLKTASLTRLETSFHQTMDNAYVEFAYFYVPSRVLWKNFDKYQGFNRDAWAQTLEFKKPQIKLVGYGTADNEGGDSNNTKNIRPGSLLNHLACPAGDYVPIAVDPDTQVETYPDKFLHIDQLPLRACYKVWNDYFRNPNVDSEIYYDDGDDDIDLSNNVLGALGAFRPGIDCLKVNRFHDLFSTCLPQPQKGDAIGIELSISDEAPIVGGSTLKSFGTNGLKLADGSGDSFGPAGSGVALGIGDSSGTLYRGSGSSFSGAAPITGSNMVADLSSVQEGLKFTINDLRTAIALQAMRERDARSGNRLNEKLYGTWHMEVSSLELDRAEFLGGKRIPVNMMEVLQTSETGTTVLGSDAGHSKTFDSDDSFIRTFTQWGYVLGFVFVRTSRSYSQGIDRKFFVEDILDEYDPLLDNVGEMPVFKKELNSLYQVKYGIGNVFGNDIDDQESVFGYQEAWYWYKERNNRYSGYFQNMIDGTLDSWHYGDAYYYDSSVNPALHDYKSEAPKLSPSWMKEGPENVDRTIAVQSNAAFQWSFNIHFDMTNTFEASKYSIPNTFGF